VSRAGRGFAGRLRRLRRSTWLLIGLCLVYRVGDAMLFDADLALHGSPARAEVRR
jgi:hypothetical protein